MLISHRLKLRNATPVNPAFAFCKPVPTGTNCALTNNGAHVNLIPAKTVFINQAIFAFRKFAVLASHKAVLLPAARAHSYATPMVHNWVHASLHNVVPVTIYQTALVYLCSVFLTNSILATI
jgi:hypothetical protein